MSEFISYKDAGVDVAEGHRAVEMMKAAVRSTYTEGVMGDIGSFGGMFRVLGRYKKPCLVSGTDGVGTKLKIAFAMDKHDTVGQDLVAMSVNDILCQGAKPLFFLDYIATGRLEAEKVAIIVEGIASGCRKGGVALLGGETAEMAGFYEEGEYDLAGFAVGIVEENEIVDGKKIKKGDILIGLPSSGVHSNGYSLVRRLFQESELHTFFPELGMKLGEELLKPTKIYVDTMAKFPKRTVRGIVHITGGGFYENIPRCLPEGLGAKIKLGNWEVPKIFKLIQSRGVTEDEMFHTFNMGIGMVVVVARSKAKYVEEVLRRCGEPYYRLGEVFECPDAVTDEDKVKFVSPNVRKRGGLRGRS